MSSRVVTLTSSLILAALLVSGCGATSGIAGARLPACGERGYRTTMLMAQSVPSASLVPCLRHEPPQWELGDMDINSAGSRLTFLTDPAAGGTAQIVIRLTGRCDTSAAIPVKTDEVGTRRLERIATVAGGYTGERYYTFAGGCVTYQVTAPGDEWTSLVRETARLWTFTTREQLMRHSDAAAPGGGSGNR